VAYSPADLLELKAALTDPTKEVWFKGRKRVLRSLSEIQEAIEIVEADLAAQSGFKPRRVTVIQSDF
jgi:hypothetical protein